MGTPSRDAPWNGWCATFRTGCPRQPRWPHWARRCRTNSWASCRRYGSGACRVRSFPGADPKWAIPISTRPSSCIGARSSPRRNRNPACPARSTFRAAAARCSTTASACPPSCFCSRPVLPWPCRPGTSAAAIPCWRRAWIRPLRTIWPRTASIWRPCCATWPSRALTANAWFQPAAPAGTAWSA